MQIYWIEMDAFCPKTLISYPIFCVSAGFSVSGATLLKYATNDL